MIRAVRPSLGSIEGWGRLMRLGLPVWVDGSVLAAACVQTSRRIVEETCRFRS